MKIDLDVKEKDGYQAVRSEFVRIFTYEKNESSAIPL